MDNSNDTVSKAILRVNQDQLGEDLYNQMSFLAAITSDYVPFDVPNIIRHPGDIAGILDWCISDDGLLSCENLTANKKHHILRVYNDIIATLSAFSVISGLIENGVTNVENDVPRISDAIEFMKEKGVLNSIQRKVPIQ